MYIEYASQTKARISNVGSEYVSPPSEFPDGRTGMIRMPIKCGRSKTDMSDLHRRQTKMSLASQDDWRN